MSLTLTSALAAPFAWTPASPDIHVQPTPGGMAGDAQLPAGTWCTLLGKGSAVRTAWPYGDALQGLAAAISAAAGVTFTLTLSATTGLVTLACPGNTFKCTWDPAMARLLGGMPNAAGFVASVTGTQAPQHMVLLASLVGNDWSQETTLATSQAEDGSVYGIRSGVHRAVDDLTLSFIPRDPTIQSAQGTAASPWFPAATALGTPGDTTTSRVWSCADFIEESLGLSCSLARGTFAALCASAVGGDLFDFVTIPGDELAAPRVAPQRPNWLAWRKWQLKVTRNGATPQSART